MRVTTAFKRLLDLRGVVTDVDFQPLQGGRDAEAALQTAVLPRVRVLHQGPL